jgi:RNA polymerase subunit RPABC4/transcription elongation factor Spt4
MTQRSGPAPAMIAVGLIVIFMAVALALGFFGVSFQRILWGPFGDHHWFRFGPVFGLFGLGALLQIFLAFWVGMDANRRGMNGLLWGLLVLFTFVVGLLVYLIVAQTSANGTRAGTPAEGGGVSPPAHEPPRTCGRCGGGVEATFRACPFCGTALAGVCASCGRPAEPGWKVCPYCSTALDA